MLIIFTVSAITPKMIAAPKTLSCKYTGRYTRRHMLTGTADSSTYGRCRCFLNRPSGREKSAAVHANRRPSRDCTTRGNQGPHVSESLGSSNSRRKLMKPETVGMSSARLARLDEVMKRRYVDGGYLPGMLTYVYRKGQLVHTGMCGRMDVERDRPMREDAIFRIYSMSKAV